jgi:hypothetical protein
MRDWVDQQESKTSPKHELRLYWRMLGFASTAKSTIKISGTFGSVIRAFSGGPDAE